MSLPDPAEVKGPGSYARTPSDMLTVRTVRIACAWD